MKHIQRITPDNFHQIPDVYRVSSLALRRCHPRPISSYRKIIKRLALLTSNNSSFQILYRGQPRDYRNEKDQLILLPSIYRDPQGGKLTRAILRKRFEILKCASKALLALFKGANYPKGFAAMRKHKELRWAILQHYQVCETPLLDVIPDIDIALSFATLCSTKGVVYAIGIPNTYEAFVHDFSNDIVYLRLDSLLPPYALRAFFQKACLIGTWPLLDNQMRMEYDVSRRLLATIEVDKNYLKRSGFSSKSQDILFPKQDGFFKICKKINKEIKKKFY